MNWDRDFEFIMRESGIEPYACSVPKCGHISRSMWGWIFHRRFGIHQD